MHCRDPDLGGQIPSSFKGKRKFLLITGVGAGIGNFLIFYPAAYYFAAFTGRDLLIMDDSLIGEMCKVINCGFPLVSDVAIAYPSLLGPEQLARTFGIHAFDFHRHIGGMVSIDEPIVAAYGNMMQSGWYANRNFTEECVVKLTGCRFDDYSCHDRHALQRLVRGPFKPHIVSSEEARIEGVPNNLKHGILTLPHNYSPRLDAAIHLRCQFSHFEFLVGPDDGEAWINAIKERDTWINSTAPQEGQGLFRIMESKIMQLLPEIRQLSADKLAVTRRLIAAYNQRMSQITAVNMTSATRTTTTAGTGAAAATAAAAAAGGGAAAAGGGGERDESRTKDEDSRLRGTSRGLQSESDSSTSTSTSTSTSATEEVYSGVPDPDKVYVYVASDNEEVKEAFSKYLIGHAHISVMRVRNKGHIVHAKNIGYIKKNGNNTGVIDLIFDWYSLSLANIVLAWRRNTDMLSTFAQSAQRMSGNTENSANDASIEHGRGSKGFQLGFNRHGHPVWRIF